MSVFTKEELEKIEKYKETNDKTEEFFNTKRDEWNKTINPLFDILKNDFNISSAQKIIEIESLALSYRQMIAEQTSFFLNKRIKEQVKIKRMKQDKFLFYATGFGLKTNLGEKSLLIDAHLAENERGIEIIENYIEFLRSSSKNLESLGYAIKDIIALISYYGK